MDIVVNLDPAIAPYLMAIVLVIAAFPVSIGMMLYGARQDSRPRYGRNRRRNRRNRR